MDSEDEDVYLTPKHLLEGRVRQNVLGQVVPKKQRPILENDTDGQNYTLARIDSHDAEVNQPARIEISNMQDKSDRAISQVPFQWRCTKSIAFIGIICILLVVIGVLVFVIMEGKKGNYNITKTN